MKRRRKIEKGERIERERREKLSRSTEKVDYYHRGLELRPRRQSVKKGKERPRERRNRDSGGKSQQKSESFSSRSLRYQSNSPIPTGSPRRGQGKLAGWDEAVGSVLVEFSRVQTAGRVL